MTNPKYLNRRNIKFFEGTLSHLNRRELLIVDPPRKRDRKIKMKRQSSDLSLVDLKNAAFDNNNSQINSMIIKQPPPNKASRALLTLPPPDIVNDPQE